MTSPKPEPVNTLHMKEENNQLCEYCKENTWKYKCPRCLLKTCSLNCSKQHKAETGCSGERSKNHFISLNQYDYNNMMSDYVFLEETSRTTDNAARENLSLNSEARRGAHRNNLLASNAKRHGVRLSRMSQGMKRRTCNKSIWHTKLKQIHWTVDWVFNECNLTLTDSRAPENKTLRELLTNHLENRPDNLLNLTKLTTYASAPLDSLILLMRVPFLPATRKEYWELSLDKPLQDSLFHKTIIEYPTIEVYTQRPEGITVVSEDVSSTYEIPKEIIPKPVEEKMAEITNVEELIATASTLPEDEEEDTTENDRILEELEAVASALSTDLGGTATIEMDKE
ncbi:Box C/D snoRNA accumulation [Basidiobolus ranarum]|uniref:Box C/D snoRNA accumulation n=1 Tax=Basidiobolus ranarum TaxID=34480 RepID=A0ABR2X531_9FUNG